MAEDEAINNCVLKSSAFDSAASYDSLRQVGISEICRFQATLNKLTIG
nr:hypothetical protein [Hymenobacter perfusus]